MIKTRIAVVAVALSFVAATACFAANPHMGTWKLNEAKSKIPAGMNKNMTVVYTEQKDKMKVEVTGVDKGWGNRRTASGWAWPTAKAYKTKGNLAWDAAVYKVVNDHTYEITTMKGGKVFSNGKSTVSADGKTRTVATEGKRGREEVQVQGRLRQGVGRFPDRRPVQSGRCSELNVITSERDARSYPGRTVSHATTAYVTATLTATFVNIPPLQLGEEGGLVTHGLRFVGSPSATSF